MKLRHAAIGIGACVPALAMANAAMGLGLEQWALTYWFAYVFAMVILEAWFIGRRIGLPAKESAFASIAANCVTGVFCGAGGLFAPGLHSAFVGSPPNPNPFMNAVALLAGFAIPSALVEGFIWTGFAKGKSSGRIIGNSVIAHIIGIPVALAILLIPSHPYIGLEGFTRAKRRWVIRDSASRTTSEIQEKGRIPDLKGNALPDIISNNPDWPDSWAALYEPDFQRFDSGEMRRVPLQWNTSLSGKQIGEKNYNWQWLLRSTRSTYQYGLE